jgi:hypothetical protein
MDNLGWNVGVGANYDLNIGITGCMTSYGKGQIVLHSPPKWERPSARELRN